MGNFFYGLYRFFERRRVLLWSLFFTITAGSVFLASRLRMEEHISGKTNHGTATGRMQQMAGNIRLTDNLIIRIFPSDTAIVPETEAMTAFAAALTDSLLSRFDSSYIGSISPNPSDTGFLYLARLVSGNLPVYLSEADYSRIDSLTRPEVIRETMQNNYRLLTTPAGMVVRDRILSDPLGITGLAMNKLKILQAGEQYSIINGYIFTSDEKNLLLFIASANPVSETARNGQLLKGIDQHIANLESRYPGIKAEYWGGIAIGVGNATQLKKDIALTLSIAILLIFLLLAWYFRNVWIPLIGFIPAIFGGIVSLALLFIIKGTVSFIALGIGAVLLGLIVDYALYIINRYCETGSIEAVLREMSQTILLCALTSIGAFFCLLFLDSSVLYDLGLFAAFSLVGAAVFALVFLPHLLGKKLMNSCADKPMNWVDTLSRIKLERKWWLFCFLLALGLLSVFFMRRVRFEEDMTALNFMTPELKAGGDRLERISEVNLKNVFLVATGEDLNQALTAAGSALPEIDLLQREGTVSQYSGVLELLLPDEIQRQRVERWKQYWTPDKRGAVKSVVNNSARSLGMKTDAFEPWFRMVEDPGSGLTDAQKRSLVHGVLRNWVTANKEGVFVTTILRIPAEKSAGIYRSFKETGTVTLFDRQQLTEQFVEGVRKDFERLVTLTMIFVTLLLIFSFGRIETGLITALPMFLSWLLTLGFMGITGIRFNIFNIIISSFIFGLGVDYSILMMRGLLRKYKYGQDDIRNYKVSIFLSSATTIIGVAALFFARHPALNSIASISVFGITAVVIISYTFQPLLTGWFLLRRQSTHQHPVTLWILFRTFITWGNIVLVAILQVILGGLIFILTPVPKKMKQYLFHWLFCQLCKAYITSTFPTNRIFHNPYNEDFSKPAVIISNHQSLMDTPYLLRLYPKIIILTNEWVWNSPLWGPIARMASFFNVDKGIDSILEPLMEKVREGYSILIFPEAHRYNDNIIHRFHKGAFYMAEKLQIDILPIVIFGSGEFLKSGQFFGRPSGLRMRILQRVSYGDNLMGSDYTERSKRFRKLFQQEYANLIAEEGTGRYYRKKLLLNYVFKGPVLEWYLRVKMQIENYYQTYNELLPRNGEILDLGCGYGFISYMLSFTSPRRKITGVDYDAEKIRVALNCFSKNDNLDFVCDDITRYSFENMDAILLSDVLHYLTPECQEELLVRCIDKIRPGGMILIRDADSNDKQLHRTTKITELFSTRIIGFNKTAGDLKELHFTSLDKIGNIVRRFELKLEVIRSAKHTSNVLFVIRK
jgi:1-acyl-sn-glycerol-3-phosphate acyltransferase